MDAGWDNKKRNAAYTVDQSDKPQDMRKQNAYR